MVVMRFILLSLMVVILCSFSYAAVTQPMPREIKLLENETQQFMFQIQNSDGPELCTLNFMNNTPLNVWFNKKNYTLKANSIKDIYGYVRWTPNIPQNEYKPEFCVSCQPLSNNSGASVIAETCGLSLLVKLNNESINESSHTNSVDTVTEDNNESKHLIQKEDGQHSKLTPANLSSKHSKTRPSIGEIVFNLKYSKYLILLLLAIPAIVFILLYHPH